MSFFIWRRKKCSADLVPLLSMAEAEAIGEEIASLEKEIEVIEQSLNALIIEREAKAVRLCELRRVNGDWGRAA